MKLLGDILYMQMKDITKAGISYDTAKDWSFKIKDPADRRCDLFAWHEIADKYKRLIIKSLGCDPYEYIAKEPIRRLIIKDYRAEAFYESYTFADGSTLYNGKKGSERIYIDRYTNDASILQAIIRVLDNKKRFKQACPGVSIAKFWTIIIEIISENTNTDLPKSQRRLLDHIGKFKNNDYAGIISPRFGNKNRAKIGKSAEGYDEKLADKQVRVIRTLLRQHNNYDNAQVANLYNVNIAIKKGWETISPATVYNIRQQQAHLIKTGNAGLRAYNNEVAMQVKRSAPTYPLAMVTVDGWTAELLYQERVTDKDGKTKVDYTKRMVIVVVLDPFCKYPLGYAIGERENTELIKQANRNALLHIRDLFGYYRPHQLQSDRYGIKELTPFYDGVSHLFTPAAVGNAKAKVIEPYFKYLNKEYCQYDRYWSGFGLQARKENQVNREYLDKIKHDMPDKQGVIAKLEAIIRAERAKKIEKYHAGWSFVADKDRCNITREQYLITFGRKTERTIKLRGEGIAPCINGVNYYFDTFNPEFRKHSQTDWQLMYDTNDEASESGLKDVLAVSADNKYRFLLDSKMLVPMAVRDQEDKHFAYRATIDQFNKDRLKEIVQTYAEDMEVVQELLENTPLNLEDHREAALKLMFTNKGQQKEALQDARGLKSPTPVLPKGKGVELPDNWQAEQMAYLGGKIDFNQYDD